VFTFEARSRVIKIYGRGDVQERGLCTGGGAQPERDVLGGDLVSQPPEADEHLAHGKAGTWHVEHGGRHGLQEVSNRSTHEQTLQERSTERSKNREPIDFK
jgi:hypothetical protein